MNVQQNIETVRGFRDILPPLSIKRQKVLDIIRKYFTRYGFLPIDTPTVEYDALLKGDNEEDSAVSDRFRLKDRGNRDLSLRFEFTVQLSRILKENPTLKLPLRRWQIGNVFRDEPIGQGRYREFTQCDADIIGDANIQADAECVALAASILNELGISHKILVNNRKLLNEICADLGISNVQEVLREVDKIQKIGEMEVKINLAKILEKEKIIRLFEMLGKNLTTLIKAGYEGAKEIKELQKYCSYYSIKAEFSPSLVRGFGYYTGSIFEIKEKTSETEITIAAGGRYDKKVGKYINRDLPAVGISFGLDRVEEIADIKVKNTTILIISIEKDEEAIFLAEKLRKEDIPIILQFGKISKGLEYANALALPYVLFLGADEVKAKKYKIRDMKSGKEEMLGIQELIKKLSSR